MSILYLESKLCLTGGGLGTVEGSGSGGKQIEYSSVPSP